MFTRSYDSCQTSLRHLFTARNLKDLWQKFLDFLNEDIQQYTSIPSKSVQAKIMHIIDGYLQSMGKSLKDYQLSNKCFNTYKSTLWHFIAPIDVA